MGNDLDCKRSPRILLVDDHDDTRRFLLLALELEGYDIVGVPTAEEALRLLEEGGFDLLLSDYCLPGHSGGWLLEQATRRRLIAAERALVLTAHPGPDGVDDFQLLRKPFELDALLTTIRDVLETPLLPRKDADDVELVLYISSHSWQSSKALRSITAALREHCPELRLTVHDLATNPAAGIRDRIVFTPTLVRRGPGPDSRLVGDCSDATALQYFLQGCRADTASPPIFL